MSAYTSIQIISGIRKLSRFLDKYSKYLNNKYQITLPQLLCLHEIQKEDGINLTELTKRININNSAITGIVDRLEAKGYVQRAKTGKDRRTINILLTEAGREFTNRSFAILEEDSFYDDGKINDEDAVSLMESLNTIIGSLDPEVKKIDLV
ncbi:MarR family winged helix-turn-helix transcriptional regulator [Limisalsivibrio acetivorans]|uniref:MarR family winged helix-turn-helix transcriptional regulator n=1 Tax=Limisalsivibrio acetivorans TaxID=1304888 RepID=UPI0003B43028|nr:MarR family transcriptional regulator [Limisalsivibrio acetivorans]